MDKYGVIPLTHDLRQQLTSPVGLLMHRWISRIADFPEDIIAHLNRLVQQFIYQMKHVKDAVRRGLYIPAGTREAREEFHATTGHPFMYYRRTGERIECLWDELTGFGGKWLGGGATRNIKGHYRETGRLPDGWHRENHWFDGYGDQWRHGQSLNGMTGDRDQTGIRAVMHPRYYGPGY